MGFPSSEENPDSVWITLRKTSFVYLDDIIHYSDSWQQHFKDVQAITDKLRQTGLKCEEK